MTAERAALLAAVCDDPDDDLARLVFADWLDEHGEPDRAEFIRLQVGLAAGTVPADRRPEAEARAAVLLDRHRAAWLAELPRRRGVSRPDTADDPLFTRGFAGAVRFLHGKAWQDRAAEAFAASPISRLDCGRTFTARTGRPVLASPLLGRVAEFTAPPLDPAGAAALADNPHLTGGRLRTLYALDTGDAVAAALARAAGLRNLATLALGGVSPAGAAALAASPHLTRLTDLRLILSPVGDDGAESLAASPSLAAVEHLMLNGAGVGDRGAAALAGSDRLPSLRELYLGDGNPVTDAGAAAIAAATGLPRLADLHLWGSQIGEAGARALADFTERRSLRTLNLRWCRVPAATVREITDRLGPDRFLF